MLLMKWHQVSQQNVFIVFSLKRVVFSLDLNSSKSRSETNVFTQALCEGHAPGQWLVQVSCEPAASPATYLHEFLEQCGPQFAMVDIMKFL